MAQGIDIDKLRTNFLQCVICRFDYDEKDHHPRIFPCLHGACYTCVQKLIKDEYLKCPHCRKEHDVPNNDVEVFLKDFTRRDLLNFVQVHDSSVVVCDNCSDVADTKKQASNRCRVCAQFLCIECSAIHQKVKTFRDHGLIKLEDLKNKTIDFEDFCLEGQCLIDGHSCAKLTLYCEECEIPICVTCAFCKHQGHDIKNIDEVFQEKKQNVMEQLDSLGKVTTEQRFVIAKIEEDFRDLYEHVANTEKSVDAETAKCKDIIESRRKNHNAHLIKIRENKYKSMQQQQQDLQDLLEETEESCEFARQALHYRNPSAFLLIEKTISDRLKELKNQNYEKELKMNSHISFDKTNIEERMKSVAETLGSIRYTSAFIPKTVVTAPQHLRMPGSTNIFVELFDYDGNPIGDGSPDVEIKIHNENNKCEEPQIIIAHCELSGNEVNSNQRRSKSPAYKAKFEPACKGKYRIEISVCKQKVPKDYFISVDEPTRTDQKNRCLPDTDTASLDISYVEDHFLACVVCKKKFDAQNHAPRVLPCLHKICEVCLQGIEAKKGRIECFLCQEPIIIIPEEINRLPEDLNFKQLQSFILAQQPYELMQSYACCDSRKKISHWCKECFSFMCGDCKRAHGQLATTKVHRLLSLHDLTVNIKDVDKFAHSMFCSEHKNQEIQMFCIECKKVLCVLCTLTHNNTQNHQTHIKPIEEVSMQEELSTRENIFRLKDRMQKVDNVIFLLENEDEITEKDVAIAIHNITAEFEKMRAILQDRENCLLNDLMELQGKKKHAIAEQRRSLETERSQLIETLHASELALMYKNNTAFLKMEPAINRRINKLCSKQLRKLPDSLGDVKFITQNEIMDGFSDVGQILYSTADLKKVISEPEAVEVNKEVQVLVHLRDANGNLAQGYLDGWKLKVSDPKGDAKDIVAKYATNYHHLQAFWKPTMEGRHVLSFHLETRDYMKSEKTISCDVKDTRYRSLMVTEKGPKSNTSDKKRIEESEQIQENVMPISDHDTADIRVPGKGPTSNILVPGLLEELSEDHGNLISLSDHDTVDIKVHKKVSKSNRLKNKWQEKYVEHRENFISLEDKPTVTRVIRRTKRAGNTSSGVLNEAIVVDENKTVRHTFRNISQEKYQESPCYFLNQTELSVQWCIVKTTDKLVVMVYTLASKYAYVGRIKMTLIPVIDKVEPISQTSTIKTFYDAAEFKFAFKDILKGFIKDDAVTIEACLLD